MPDNILNFVSARSIAESEPEEPDSVIEQIAIKGAITLFSAKIKVGKTTFLGASLYAILHDESIIGLRTQRARILYCTEEGRKTFRAFLKRTGLDGEDDLEVLFLGSVQREITWPVVVKNVLGHALSINADVVIFDTLTRWAHVKPEQENDAGAAAAAMEPLELLRAANLCVIAVFHDRKSGGDVSDSTRGSSAFGGSADVLLNLVHSGTNGHTNRRVLSSLGRFDDPAIWTIDWEDGAYILRAEGEDQRVERDDMQQTIQSHLMMGQHTNDELKAALGVSPKDQTYRRALDELMALGKVERSGMGKRGSPFVFSLA